MLLKLSTARNVPILMIDSADHVTGKTGLTLTLTLSKDGAAFASISPTVTELSNGWYNVAATTSHSNTLGAWALHATGMGADPTDVLHEVVSEIPGIIATDGIAETSFAASSAKYQAKIWLFDDDVAANDRYTVAWFKNGEPIFSGITSPTIQVFKAVDGTDLIASTAMTQIGSTGTYRYNESTNRISDGAGYLAKISASIDGSTRYWVQPVGRDS